MRYCWLTEGSIDKAITYCSNNDHGTNDNNTNENHFMTSLAFQNYSILMGPDPLLSVRTNSNEDINNNGKNNEEAIVKTLT